MAGFILMVLGAILFPVYACACTKTSPGITCQSQIKKLAMGVIMYTSDYDDRLPNRDSWMNAIHDYTKDAHLYTDPDIKAKGQHGYAFDSRLSNKNQTLVRHPDQHPLVYDSINLARNASDPFNSLPNPGRHEGRNSIGYLDGHAKRIALPKPK